MAKRGKEDTGAGRHPEEPAAEERSGPHEILIVGDLTEHEGDIAEKLLDPEPGGTCVLYFNSLGGSPYSALALASLIRLRGLDAVGVITGECSSAALWPFAACRRRFVTRHAVALFHPMKWQSEENVGLHEAAEWARHFGELERDMDLLLADMLGVRKELIDEWNRPGRYVTARELIEAGIAQGVGLEPLKLLQDS